MSKISLFETHIVAPKQEETYSKILFQRFLMNFFSRLSFFRAFCSGNFQTVLIVADFHRHKIQLILHA